MPALTDDPRLAVRVADKGVPLGVASLGGDGVVPPEQLPAAIGGPFVTSVNGHTGAVTLGYADVGAVSATDPRLGDARTPTGAAGGALTGTYPNPSIAANAVSNAQVAAGAAIAYSKLNLAGSIVHGDVAAANIDGAAGTPSLRTLGPGAAQAAAGNDVRFAIAPTVPLGGKGYRDTFGTFDHATVLALIGNRSADPSTQVMGTADPSATNERGSVTVYADNSTRAPTVDSTSTTFTASTVTFGVGVDLSNVLPGMLVDTGTAPYAVGTVASVSGQTITLDAQGWRRSGATATTPANGTRTYVNQVTAVWALNANVFSNSTSDAQPLVGFELGVSVARDDSAVALSASEGAGSRGFDVLALSSAGRPLFAYTARGRSPWGYSASGMMAGADGHGAGFVYHSYHQFTPGSTVEAAFLDYLGNGTWGFKKIATAGTDGMMGAYVGTEGYARHSFDVDGKHYWGTGAAAADTTLYRVGAAALKADAQFISTSYLTAFQGGANQVIVGYLNGVAGPSISLGSGADVNIYRAGSDRLKTDDAFEGALHGRFMGTGSLSGGPAAEVGYDTTASQAYLIGYDRTAAAYVAARLDASSISLQASATEKLRVNATGIGFLGATPVARAAATADLRQALIDYGLYTSGGASPLSLNGGTLNAGALQVAGTALASTHLSDSAALARLASPTFTGTPLAANYRAQAAAASGPRFSWYGTGAGADQGKWQAYSFATSLNFTALNDAESSETAWMTVTRGTGTAVSSIALAGTAVTLSTGATERLKVDGTGIGFFAHTTQARPSAYTLGTVTASRALTDTSNTAAVLRQVIADLQGYGLLQ